MEYIWEITTIHETNCCMILLLYNAPGGVKFRAITQNGGYQRLGKVELGISA